MKVCISSNIMKKAFTKVGTTKRLIKLGRGARNQRDPFHQSFLDEKDRLRPFYKSCRTHKQKRSVQQMLIDWVKQSKGHFVKESTTDKNVLVEVTDQKKLLQKAAQALREPRKKALSKAVLAAKTTAFSVVDVPVMKIVQAIRGPYSASKAVHSSEPVSRNECYHKSLASKIDWSKNKDDFAMLERFDDIVARGTPGIYRVHDHDMMLTLKNGNNVSDPSMDKAASTNPTTHPTLEDIDIDSFMNMPEEEFWLLANELLND